MCKPASASIPTPRCCSAWCGKSPSRSSGPRASRPAHERSWSSAVRKSMSSVHLVDLDVAAQPVEEAAAVQRQRIGLDGGLDFLELLPGERVGQRPAGMAEANEE